MGVEEHATALRAGEGRQGPGLPPHYPTCFGCGPEAEAGLHLVAQLDGSEVVASYTFSEPTAVRPASPTAAPLPRSPTTSWATC